MSDVFISYVEEDSAVVQEIAQGLETAGYSTWYYEEKSVGGVPYLDQVIRAINDCQVVVLAISQDSIGSEQVEAEVLEAFECRKLFIPLLKDLSYVEFQSRKPRWDG